MYFGADTEDPLATRAINETRGVVATYDGELINALYSSTCGGRTESVENIFEEKLPYLVSVSCEYKHPEPRTFTTSRVIADFQTAVLTVAGVSNYSDARRFLGVGGVGEPPSTATPELAQYLRETFYSGVKTRSDVEFLIEQGILPGAGAVNRDEVLYRLIDRKGAFEWQQGILISWDGQILMLAVGGKPTEFRLSPDAPIFFRMGEERTAMQEGELDRRRTCGFPRGERGRFKWPCTGATTSTLRRTAIPVSPSGRSTRRSRRSTPRSVH